MSAATSSSLPSLYTPLSLKRIARDVEDVMTQLPKEGIFWIPSETHVGTGHAVIMGPHGTPYFGGAFCFSVGFPTNYPFMPPSFSYLTNDGVGTRFNPNLYTTGKVCLSLLNTWPGEPWSSTQSLKSVLLSIQSMVLVEYPLENEPAYYTSRTVQKPLFDQYNRLITHAVAETAILRNLTKTPDYLIPAKEAVAAWIAENRVAIVAHLRTLGSVWDGTTDSMSVPFRITTKFHFKKLADDIDALPLFSTKAKETSETCEF